MLNREGASVRILLASNDLPTIEMLCEHIQGMSMHVEPCCDVESGGRRLCRSKFEGVIIDFKEKEQSLRVLQTMMYSTSHKTAVAFAVLNHENERAEAFDAGAIFVLERPLVAKKVLNTFRAALPLMVRERRRYYRCPLDTDVQVATEAGDELSAKAINVSEGGMAFHVSTSLQSGQKLRLSFCLPDSENRIIVPAEVCWTNAQGQVGAKLVDSPSHVTTHLQMWLSEKLELMMPSLA